MLLAQAKKKPTVHAKQKAAVKSAPVKKEASAAVKSEPGVAELSTTASVPPAAAKANAKAKAKAGKASKGGTSGKGKVPVKKENLKSKRGSPPSWSPCPVCLRKPEERMGEHCNIAGCFLNRFKYYI